MGDRGKKKCVMFWQTRQRFLFTEFLIVIGLRCKMDGNKAKHLHSMTRGKFMDLFFMVQFTQTTANMITYTVIRIHF